MFHIAVPIMRRTWMQVLLAAMLVAAADYLFYRHTPGISQAIFGGLLLLAVSLRGARKTAFTAATGWLQVALIGLIVALIVDVNFFAIVLGVLGLVTLAIANRQGWVRRPLTWTLRWIEFTARAMTKPVADAAFWMQRVLMRGTCAHRGGRAVLNWLLPIAFTLIFLSLFLLANPVLSRWVDELRYQLDDLYKWLHRVRGDRLLLWAVFAWVSWALLRIRARWRRKSTDTMEAVAPAAARRLDVLLSPAVVARCLILFNALFGVQTIMDAMYLFGGATLPPGLTYAQYAHRGAYPLVCTALLAAAFMIVAFRSGGPAERSPVARRLVYLWIAQNIALTITAMWRLHLYIGVFTLSRWRVAAVVWLVLVILGLLWILVRIVRGYGNAWLIGVNALTLLVVLYGMAWVDVDRMIAWYNVRNCREVGGKGIAIDTVYLHSLGPEALPAVHWLSREISDPQVLQSLDAVDQSLRRQLALDTKNWRAWTWQRHRLASEFLAD